MKHILGAVRYPRLDLAPSNEVSEALRPLHRGEFDHTFSRYMTPRGPQRVVLSIKPYVIRFGQIVVGEYQSDIGKLRISIHENSKLRRERPKWWISGFSRFEPWALSLFDTLIDIDRVRLLQQEEWMPPSTLWIDQKLVCAFYGQHAIKVRAVVAAGIQRCRLLGFFDPFETDADRLAYLGEFA